MSAKVLSWLVGSFCDPLSYWRCLMRQTIKGWDVNRCKVTARRLDYRPTIPGISNLVIDGETSIPFLIWGGRTTRGCSFIRGLGFNFVGNRCRGGGPRLATTKLTWVLPRKAGWMSSCSSISGWGEPSDVRSLPDEFPLLDFSPSWDAMKLRGEEMWAYLSMSSEEPARLSPS